MMNRSPSRAWALIVLASCHSNDTAGSQPPSAKTTVAPIDDGEPPVIDGDHNLIRNGAFANGTISPWKSTLMNAARGEARLEDEQLCLRIDESGTTGWDAQLRHRALRLQQGHAYLVEFTAVADRDTQLMPRVGQVGPPYDEYWASTVSVSSQPQRYVGHFTMRSSDDAGAELSFIAGGPLAAEGGVKVCLDDVAISDPDYEPPPPPDHLRAPAIRVNQLGYFPQRTKKAVYRSAETKPLPWRLLDAEGNEVASGTTQPFGDDRASGDNVHWIDFSSVKQTGSAFTLGVGEDQSDPFAIQADLYEGLKYDAIAFYYHNRSGIEIEMPYAGEKRWARAAGHLSDKAVECKSGLGCKGSFDVSGGWYDAGDHGKYVVNAGISVWTLLNFYERTQAVGGDTEAFADGKLSIPEQNNGANDLLDEVRWELEFLLKMQVPSAHERWGGMAFHKLHEDAWSGIPLAPGDAKEPRFLHRPSTAATLNLAAVAAQAARVYQSTDPAFAKRCLAAAERAWTAAQKTPDLLAPGDDNVGGGPYEDKVLDDEFYWAAMELYLTTGKGAYEQAAKGKHFGKVSGPGADQGGQMSPMNWQQVASLGTLSLAVAGTKRAPAAAKAARAEVVEVARAHAESIATQGYRVPLAPNAAGNYPWGSNSLVLNNALLLGLAYDFSRDPAFLDATVEAFDYLLGRNPVWQSYVTGYGANPLENPHHRFWALQADEAYPGPPPGIVSGGPNSSIQDPYAQASGLGGCPAQRCFVDHIESWSTNEIAINWNAPFFWVAAFLDETAGGGR